MSDVEEITYCGSCNRINPACEHEVEVVGSIEYAKGKKEEYFDVQD